MKKGPPLGGRESDRFEWFIHCCHSYCVLLSLAHAQIDLILWWNGVDMGKNKRMFRPHYRIRTYNILCDTHASVFSAVLQPTIFDRKKAIMDGYINTYTVLSGSNRYIFMNVRNEI